MISLLRNEIIDLVDNSKSIELQITDWFIPESDKLLEKKEEPDKYTIKIYGTDNDNVSICITVIDYEPYFYVKPPIEWEKLNDKDFLNKVRELNTVILEERYESIFKDPKSKRITKYNKKILPNGYESHFNSLTIENKKDFWGFTNNKIFRFIKVTVKSLYLYNILKYYFQSLTEFKLYESNIDPFLKFIHIQNIKPCGWIRIDKYEIDNSPNSRCDYNLIVKWNNIIPININKIAPLIIASFDIECMSSHGDFPQAKKNYKKLAQDLCSIVKAGYEYNNNYLKAWILNAYNDDVIIDEDYKINKLYYKNSLNIEKIISRLDKNLDMIRLILEKVETIKCNDDEDEENEKVNITVKEYNDIEDKLTNLLSSFLPDLEGDKIIQIGTTVHKYGSDDIIYKNIITLNTCDKIEDVDVIECKTEKELLMEWKRIFININPDVLIGYNICGFDMEYIWLRVLENNILDDFSIGLGKTINRKCILTEQRLASSALGENILKSFDIDGIVIIDLLKVVQRDHKLDSYKLDNVASVFVGSNKDDLKPNEIFKKFKGGSEDRCVIAKYCIQDCILCNKILHKLKIIENNMGMGNVCLVPFNYLFKRGQGIKIFSLLNNECMKKNYLIPVIKKYIVDEFDEGFEGAIVLNPKEGIYLNEPIVVFDYGSLYPSSMISRNLSHDTYINDKKYMIEDPNIEYKKISYDIYEGLGDKKVKTGVKECIFAQYKDGKKGIIPEILNMLLQERKNTRNKIEYITIETKDNNKYYGFPTETDNNITLLNIDTKEKIIIDKNNINKKYYTYNNFEKDVFDSLQSAYKITANSLYGQIGAKTSPIYLKDIAACTTSTGREMIMIAKEFVEKEYNADVIYGDSVMPYTPITFKIGLKSTNVYVETIENLNNKEWYDYLQFKMDDIDRTHKEQCYPDNMYIWTYKGWTLVKKIIRHKTIKKIYRIITNSGIVDVSEDHSLLLDNFKIIKPNECKIGDELLHSRLYIDYHNNSYITNEEAYKIACLLHINENTNIPDDLINSDNKVLRYFKKGLLVNILNRKIYETSNHLNAQKIILIFQKLEYNTIINYNDSNKKIKLTFTKYEILDDKIIKDIILLHENYSDYIYDIETEEGVFHGGIGNIILKNTDSIFCKFSIKDVNGYEIQGKEALPYAINIGKEIEKKIAKILPAPQKLNYEKSFYPFILFSKKKYVGNLYETDINKYKQKSMGIVLKRRDNAPIVKKIYGGIIDIILNKQDLDLSINFLREELIDLVNGNVDIKELILSKTLKSNYKDPTKIAHKVLADRIGSRDLGNKPSVNDRIQYVYIKVNNAKLQGDKIETPEYIKDNSLIPDYLHYITNQIMKPIMQLYALCLDQLPNYDKSNNYWNDVEQELLLKPLYIDDIKRKNRLDNLKLQLVEELLFKEFIDILSEPKIKKERKKIEKKEEKVIIIDETLYIYNGFIKITKKGDNMNIKSHIEDENKKKIREYTIEKKDTNK